MNILVTGGAGFIGSNLVSDLVDKGFNVYVIDNLSTGDIENIRELIESNKIEFYKGDIRDQELISKVVNSCDVVIHCAAIVSVQYSIENPVETNSVNIDGTVNLLNTAVNSKVKNFIFISSCSVYGNPLYLPIDESHPLNPISPYAISKLSAEKYVSLYSRLYDLNSVILRLFNVYGPRQGVNPYSGVIVKFINRVKLRKPPIIFGDGLQTRDFIYVMDVAKAIELSIEFRGKGEIFNIGSGKEITIKELAEMIMDLFNVKYEPIFAEPRPGDIKRSVANIHKAVRHLNFWPEIELKEGLAKTIQYYIKTVK